MLGDRETSHALGPPSVPRLRRLAVTTRLPAVRLLWIFLAGLGAYGSVYLLGLGATALVGVPGVAVAADLLLQKIRYPALRFPDAAIATGLFLALIFPPTAPLPLTGSCAIAAIALRHVLRYRGRPWFNPAMTGAVTGVLILGLVPAWWVGIGRFGEGAMIALGLLLVVRDRRSWRLPAIFLLTYGGFSIFEHLLLGASTDPAVLLLLTFDPATLFFALFIVPEPRSAPRLAGDRVPYAAAIGLGASVLPLVLPTLALFASLAGGNLLNLGFRRQQTARSVKAASPSEPRLVRRWRDRERRAAASRPDPWPISRRVIVGIISLILLGAVAGTVPSPHAAAPIVHIGGPIAPPSGRVGTASCTTDNPAIPSSTVMSLHKILGPSIILSYDPSNGVVTFYDPVNHVTVTETDLYEDYGFAEFNEDDYAVDGCTG